jgi:hypothetical protein
MWAIEAPLAAISLLTPREHIKPAVALPFQILRSTILVVVGRLGFAYSIAFDSRRRYQECLNVNSPAPASRRVVWRDHPVTLVALQTGRRDVDLADLAQKAVGHGGNQLPLHETIYALPGRAIVCAGRDDARGGRCSQRWCARAIGKTYALCSSRRLETC